MTDLDKISGVKSFLRRTKTTAELEALALATYASATEEVTITMLGSEGATSSGTMNFPKWLLLQIVEELLGESTSGRQLMSFPDWRTVRSAT